MSDDENKITLEFNPHSGAKFMKINGKLYGAKRIVNKNGSWGRIEFVEIDKKEYEEEIRALSEKLSKNVSVSKIISQALRVIPVDQLKEISSELNKKKPKIRTQEGCYILKIGKRQLFLRD